MHNNSVHQDIYLISRVNLTSKLEAYINLTYPVSEDPPSSSDLSIGKQPVPSPPSWPAVSNGLSSSFLLKCCNDSKISHVFKGLVSPRSLICSNKSFVGGLPKFFPSFFCFRPPPLQHRKARSKSLVVGLLDIKSTFDSLCGLFSLCPQLKHCNLAFSLFRYFQRTIYLIVLSLNQKEI